MKKILHVTSSPRGEGSNSIKLGNRIVEKLKNKYHGSTVVVNSTVDKNYTHFTAIHPEAYLTPGDVLTTAQKDALRDSDEAVQQLLDADIIVISMAMYNFNMPSALKAWLDHVIRAGRTFSYKTGAPEGLAKGKKVYLAIASSGVYSDGPMKSFDFAEPYLRYILGFIGITDITTYRIEGTGIPGIKEHSVQKGLESVAL
jgi:FMN-dependent NADH-azoreductase